MAHRPILKIALLGFGSTAHAFLSHLQHQEEHLPFTPAIGGIIFKEKGYFGFLDKAILLEDLPSIKPRMHQFTGGVHRFLKRVAADVVVELTPLNIQNGEPAAGYLRAALNNGLHVITANKGPLAFHFAELNRLAIEKKLRFRFGATVGNGIPIFSMKRYAAPTVKLTGIRAQLNATTNYVLTRMQDGVPEIQAIAEAQASGLCRNTPQLELDGWDGSIQSAILANVLMREIQVEHVFREKFQQRAPEIIKRTTKNIHKVRQIVNIENLPGEIKASVRLQVISADDPFYHLNADDCAITLKTETMGDLTLTLKTPGKEEIAAALLADLYDIYYRGVTQQKDPELFELDRDELMLENLGK